MPIKHRGIQVQLGAFDEKGHGGGTPPDRDLRFPSLPISASGYAEYRPIVANDTRRTRP